MDSSKRKVALVTGASSGIGETICWELARIGFTVVGSARRGDRLQILRDEIKAAGYPGELHPVHCDQRNEEDIIKLFHHIDVEFGRLDASIINAGIVKPGPILHGTTNEWREMMEVNVLGTSICLRESVRLLRKCENGSGHLVVMGSGLGHRVPPAPIMHFYSATKFAVCALTEAVRQELVQEHSKIRVTHIAPGPVRTEAPHKTFPNMDPAKVEELLYGEFSPLSPKDVADTVIFVLSAAANVNLSEISVNPIDGDSIPRPKSFQ